MGQDLTDGVEVRGPIQQASEARCFEAKTETKPANVVSRTTWDEAYATGSKISQVVGVCDGLDYDTAITTLRMAQDIISNERYLKSQKAPTTHGLARGY